MIREAKNKDWDAIWPIFNDIVARGDTYAYEINTSKQQAKELWLEAPNKTYLYEQDNEILGTYYIKTNQLGPGKHVCNCGYMVANKARGRGLATQMCEHSQKAALDLGYIAMQFNFVAVTNVGALRLWEKLGFDIVGRLPKAFNHPTQGYVDACIMYKWLADK